MRKVALVSFFLSRDSIVQFSSVAKLTAETVFIVGAGFSHHAGLPLTNGFTKAILEARDFSHGPSRMMVDFLSRFIHDAFDHSRKAGAKHWPDLEDIFTCVDLSANSGHHLGKSFAPADLRSVRRALLARIIRMLDQKYRVGRSKKGPDWWRLDDFFSRISDKKFGFVSMNWDTVIERKLELIREDLVVDYGCDALPAAIPDPPNFDDFRSSKKFIKKLKEGQVIALATRTRHGHSFERGVPVIKIHGSANWLYCDNCRRLFWFHPDQCNRIADQLIKEDDLRRITRYTTKATASILEDVRRRPEVYCTCANNVPLGTRIATFSYRKALEFPMFQKSWFAAEELLRSAKRWIFIGYSLPPADFEFKYLLKRTQLSMPTTPEFIVVSGGRPRDMRRTYDNYQKFFGRTIKKSRFFSSGLTREAMESI
ncbi:MAG TPA: hypothetical protein VFA85_00405 [Terriglobales bacterium]|nr:hypothetical protein [Terriglobales bacterium]